MIFAQIMPLYITIGAGCAMCMYVCGLKVTTYPDIVYANQLSLSATP